MNDFRIPWAKPFVGAEEIAAVLSALTERRMSMGADVRSFERQTAEMVGRAHGIAVANGTVALDVAMKLIDLRAGDEVLVSSLSYIATTNCIFWQGARPVFADVDPVTLNIDPRDAASRVTARTRALIVADYCGSPVDYDALTRLCDRHGLQLVVDGAQSLGAYFRGRPTISHGIVATTSFHTAKAMICGEGGMVFCDADALAERARKLRGQGEIPGRKYVHDTLAYNYRLTEIAAAIGRVQLGRAPEILARRAALAERYTEQLSTLAEVQPTGHSPFGTPAWFSFAVRVPNRDAVAERLRELGVETRSLYPLPAYRQPIAEYQELAPSLCPQAELASSEVLNLPMFYEMTGEEVDDVVDCLATAIAEQRLTAQPVPGDAPHVGFRAA